VAMTYGIILYTRQFNSVLDDELETNVLNNWLCVLEDWREAVDPKHNKDKGSESRLPNNTVWMSIYLFVNFYLHNWC